MRGQGTLHAAIDHAARDGRWADVVAVLDECDDVDACAEALRGITDLETLHRVRQEHLRRRDATFVGSQPRSRRARHLVAALHTDGITRLRGLIPRRRLRRIRHEIDDALCALEPVAFRHYDQKQYWRDDQQALVCNDGLALSRQLASIARHRVLVETANQYLGTVAHVKRIYAMRYLPKEQPDSHQFGWHHDMEDRMLKVMLLLSDVTLDDQFMTYVIGTHHEFHPYECFLRNSLSFDQIGVDPATARTKHTIGRAGDLFLFDPNGMHRGRRSLGARRDAVFFEFTADANRGNVWGSELGLSDPELFATDRADPLHRFRNLTPKWVRHEIAPRTRTTWAESLGEPERWLRRAPSSPAPASADTGSSGLPTT